MELMDAERLEDAKVTDRRYHDAKLMAAGFNEPGRVWEEHEAYRNDLLTPSAPTAAPDVWEQAKAIHEKVRRLGLVTHIPEGPH